MEAKEALDYKPLMGTEEATIDDKGRLLLGKRKRDRLGDDFVVAIGPMGCLVAYPRVVWDRMWRELNSYEYINQGRERLTRLMLGDAQDDINCDQQGRFVVPQRLRHKAKLDKEAKALLIGCGERLEIWNLREYEEAQRYPETYGRERRAAFEEAWETMRRGGTLANGAQP
jgi:MraZ protein